MKTIQLLLLSLLGLLVSVNCFSEDPPRAARLSRETDDSRRVLEAYLKWFRNAVSGGRKEIISVFLSRKFELHTCDGTFDKKKMVEHLLGLPKGRRLETTVESSKYTQTDVVIEFVATYDGFGLKPEKFVGYLDLTEGAFVGGREYKSSECALY